MSDLNQILDFLIDVMSRFVRVLSFSFVGQLILGAFIFSILFTLIVNILKNSNQK